MSTSKVSAIVPGDVTVTHPRPGDRAPSRQRVDRPEVAYSPSGTDSMRPSARWRQPTGGPPHGTGPPGTALPGTALPRGSADASGTTTTAVP